MAIRKIDLMHKLFGLSPNDGETCKTCQHLIEVGNNRKYYKCFCYGNTHSEASDWRVGYRACGNYNRHYEGRKIIELVKPDRREQDHQTIPGQMSIFDYMGENT